MYYAYSLLLVLVLLIWSPLLLLGALGIRRHREGWGERLGRYPPPLIARLHDRHPVWLHAVSVGEVGAASVLAAVWTTRHPELALLVSTVTATGREVARRSLPQAAGIVYFPFDLGIVVDRVLAMVRPRLILLTETEIWPNFLRGCRAAKIPVAVINGRISPRSFRRYRMVRPFFCRVLQGIDLFCMQSVADAERMLALGASPERVHVVGNLKFDAIPPADATSLDEQWRERLKIGAGRPVIVAGSTHPGEDEAVLRAFVHLRREFPELLLIVAPRHPDRLGAVEALIAANSLAAARRTTLTRTSEGRQDVVLLDTVGELSMVYAVASAVFIGGSLVPSGGHNLLEPAALGRPILFGPHMDNFAEASALFLEREAAVQIHGPDQLAPELARLLRDPSAGSRMGKAALECLAAHRGACERTVALLERYV
jgi:3-deoxy-D-manno-octulosonic-acid transferase